MPHFDDSADLMDWDAKRLEYIENDDTNID